MVVAFFNCFGDCAAEAAGGAGMRLRMRRPTSVSIEGGGRDRRAVDAHHLAAERLLFVGNLDHVDLAVEAEIGAGHRKRRAPLTCAGLGGHAHEALLLGIIGLGDGGIELVAAGGVVALKLIVDLSRSAELLFQVVGADQRRGRYIL